ncbi:MAG: arsenite methyltransferase [Candidatus Aminicenantes bacterium]|nr:arsenite methyltransferase [Candidatus Aminicenantes bacterium]NIM84400.1 arsenite methyltransferase [Candidatus Aminicenantes bacterium]NIN23887.1 arsenite methyltransferase [Candidatus Aminicenantes bacterium]NIN47603.1 arsenite methyltransferase [Candidatus Aminicenantes bacterium]NIN90523.1 arsenite methyltransferase [Candidatus Aminicenantes bacterium]
MQDLRNDEIRQAVRESYGEIAKTGAVGCGCDCGCGLEDNPTAEDIAIRLGYSNDEVTAVPEGANMGLGCGNPQAIASLKPGETVLDLGSGGGFDCFLAARAVGKDGYVIGVDMTPEMISKARENGAKAGIDNVEFRLGEIENLPVADHSVDVIISNCVINLSPQKPKVYKEAFRILKPGGRLAISDVVAVTPLPDEVKKNLALYTGCISGASSLDELKSMLDEAGFTDIRIESKDKSKELIRDWAQGSKIEDFVVSAAIEAVKPLSN